MEIQLILHGNSHSRRCVKPTLDDRIVESGKKYIQRTWNISEVERRFILRNKPTLASHHRRQRRVRWAEEKERKKREMMTTFENIEKLSDCSTHTPHVGVRCVLTQSVSMPMMWWYDFKGKRNNSNNRNKNSRCSESHGCVVHWWYPFGWLAVWMLRLVLVPIFRFFHFIILYIYIERQASERVELTRVPRLTI